MKKHLLIFCVAIIFIAEQIANAQYFQPISKMDVPSATTEIDMNSLIPESCFGTAQVATICKEAGAGISPYKNAEDVPGDFSAMFKLCWDYTYLYLYAEITDDVQQDYVRGAANSWTWDCVEAFLDLDTNSDPALQNVDKIQLRFTPGLKDAANRDSLVESAGGNVTAADFKFIVGNDYSQTLTSGYGGYKIKVAIPWAAAVSGEIDPNMHNQMKDVIGFDIGVSDADGDQEYPDVMEGGRNVAGGSQAFWDIDEPWGTGNEDNAYQNRRTYGLIKLTEGIDCPCCFEGNQLKSANCNDINEANISSINIFPNPSNGTVTFSNLVGISTIEIYNMMGIRVKTISNEGDEITVLGLPSGLYFAKINNESAKFVIK